MSHTKKMFRYVAAQLTALKELNPQSAGWAKLQIETVLYNAQFPAGHPGQSSVHAQPGFSSAHEEPVRYLEQSSSLTAFNYVS